jgi:N utilization substance protein B
VSDVLESDYCLDVGPLDDYASELALGADSMLHELDAVIGATSSNWSVSRMPSVDRNLLRLALYEMLEVEAVDEAVAIDECVELAKAYGTDESSRFVNGVLGKVSRRRAAGVDVVADALERMAQTDEPEAAEDDQDEAQEPVEADATEVAPEDLPDWARE